MKLSAATGEERYRRSPASSSTSAAMRGAHTLDGPYNQDHRPVSSRTRPWDTPCAPRTCIRRWSTSRVADARPALPRGRRSASGTTSCSRKLYLTGASARDTTARRSETPSSCRTSTAYGETCASVASVYWNQRLFLQSGDARYVDVLERTLYNAALAGVSLRGDTFFYPNPARGGRPLRLQPGGAHALSLVRLLVLPDQHRPLHPIGARLHLRGHGDALFVNLYVASHARDDVGGGRVDGHAADRVSLGRRASRVRLAPAAPRRSRCGCASPGGRRSEPRAEHALPLRGRRAAGVQDARERRSRYRSLSTGATPPSRGRGRRATGHRCTSPCRCAASSPTSAWRRSRQGRARTRSVRLPVEGVGQRRLVLDLAVPDGARSRPSDGPTCSAA